MLKEAEIIKKLSTMVDKRRLKHIFGVRDTAIILAEEYNADIEKAKVAALLHDCAKNLSEERLIKKAKEADIIIDDVYQQVPTLLHAPVGAEIAKEEFEVEDEEILKAISLHTLGGKNMTLLDKIIFLADYIEPNRQCKAINELREAIVDKTLDQSVRLACENTIGYNLKLGKVIHLQSIELRNSLISN